MELYDLEYGLKAVSSGGHTLNCQEMTCLQAGLSMLKAKSNLSQVYFWGKIFGSSTDYYVAYVLSEVDFEFPSKIFFYAGEDFDFKEIPRLTEEIADGIIDLGIDTPFTGDPTAPVGPAAEGEVDPMADPEAAALNEATPKLTEVERLAQVIQEIDFDTAVVPKGGHALNEAHAVVTSSDFKGLGLKEATDLKKYLHFRPPTSVASLRALARSDVQFYSDFLDPLEGDLPKGCWAVRQDASIALVTLRSLSWPGYIAFHVPGTTKFGGIYFGYANKNRDLPFIL